MIRRHPAPIIAMTAAAGLVIAQPTSAAAATPRKKAAAPAKKLSDTEFLLKAIAINALGSPKSVPQDCTPKRFELLAEALHANEEWLTREQGEFESKAEFEARQANLTNTLAAVGQIYVCWKLTDTEAVDFRYDPEKALFNGSLLNRPNVWREGRTIGSYLGQTRMRVKFRYTVKTERNYDLILPHTMPMADAACWNADAGNTFTVPVKEDAAVLKYLGRFVLVGHLSPPYVRYHQGTDVASLDDPVELHSSTIETHMTPDSAMIVDAKGNVVWSCVLSGTVPKQG